MDKIEYSADDSFRRSRDEKFVQGLKKKASFWVGVIVGWLLIRLCEKLG